MDFSICLGCTQLKLNPLRGEFWGPRRQLSMEKQIRFDCCIENLIKGTKKLELFDDILTKHYKDDNEQLN